MSGSPFDRGLIQSMRDVAPSWMWTVDITNIGQYNQSLQNIYVQQANFPFQGIETEPRFRAGKYQSFPKHAGIGVLSLTFYEDYLYTVTTFLQAWFDLVRDVDGNFGLPVNYMGNAVLRLYDPAGILQKTVTANGVWPLHRSNFDLQYGHSGEMQVSCDFACNDTIMDSEQQATMFPIGSISDVGSNTTITAPPTASSSITSASNTPTADSPHDTPTPNSAPTNSVPAFDPNSDTQSA